MIICSCNAFSDPQVRFTVANSGRRLRISQIYGWPMHPCHQADYR